MITITLMIIAILAIIFGILVLIWPKILNILVALWFILYGVLTLLENYISFSIA
jgi:hypothetical protein